MNPSPNSPRLRLALVGTGAIAQRHLQAIEECPDVFALAAVCDPNPDAIARVRKRFPDVPAFPDVDELLGFGDFDAAVIATPHFLHFDQAAALAGAGFSVLVEKPIVTTTADMRRLQEIADRSGAIVLAGQTRRFAPEVVLARETTRDADAFGQLQSFDILSFQDLRPYAGTNKKHWLFDGKLAGGGVTISLAIHQIDMVRFLSGDDYIGVMAAGRFDAPFINGAESQIAAVLELSGGARGTLHADYLATRIPFAEAMTLIGDNGSVTQHAAWLGQYRGPFSSSTSHGVPSDHFDDQLRGWGQLEAERDDAAQVQVSFTQQLLHFAAVLSGEVAPASSIAQNFNTIATIEAIVTSARSGSRVEVARW